MPRRIYLDNAATSFPKPDAVYAAMDAYNRRVGAAVGRGAYGSAVESAGIADRCRRRAAELLGAESPERIVLAFNGTDGLNVALHGALRPGDHVVTSAIEHNSVLRPLREMRERLGIDVTYVGTDRSGRVDPEDIQRGIKSNTRLITLIHASNVSGALQPVEEVGRIARQAGALFLVDAAQTAGHVPIDVRTLGADLLACAGHKGLLGPLGTGLLYVRPGVEKQVASFRQGGTGTQSEEDRQPETMPEKYESGNHNGPGLAGLEAGLTWIQTRRGIEAIRAHEIALTIRLCAGFSEISGVQVYGPENPEDRVGVVSITFEAFEPQEAAAILDQTFGIEVRAGLHCAPGAHRALGTFEPGGTVRFSVGPFTTEDDVDAAIEAVLAMSGP